MKRLPNNALHKALVPFLREKTGYRVYDYVPETAQLTPSRWRAWFR